MFVSFYYTLVLKKEVTGMSQVKSKDLRKVSKNFVHQKWFDLLSFFLFQIYLETPSSQVLDQLTFNVTSHSNLISINITHFRVL